MKMEQDPRFKRLEAIVGAFVIGALAAVIAAVMYVGTENDLFGEKYHIRFRSETGTGIQKGLPVKLSGFRIGRIQKISLDDQAKVIVRMKIDRKYSKWIRADSTATLRTEGLVGDSLIDISVGSPGSPALSNEDFLPFQEEEGLNDIAIELSDSIKSVLLEVRQTVAYINDPQGDIKRMLANVRQLSADLEETRRNADVFLLSATDNVGRIGPALDNLSAVIDNVGRRLNPLLDNVGVRLPALLDRVEGTVTNTEKITGDLRKAAEAAAPRIPPLLSGAEELVGDADDLAKGLKKMWPFKKYIPPETRPGIVPGDSHE
jgi:phospholipid/cholesterol/gamma-HCH transport system substrate-binding protein